MSNQQIEDDSDLRRYYASVPHIADDEMDPYQYRLYGHYKRVCGEKNGQCTENTATTAKKTGMGMSKVKSTRKWLADNGWIRLRYEGPSGDQTANIRIIDRWRENFDKYAPPSPDNGEGSHDVTPPPSPDNGKRKTFEEKHNGVTEPAPEPLPVPATPPPSVHVTAAAIANDEILETSLLGLLERINGAIRKKKSDARIITGTKALARKLAQRGETADTVKAAWLTCKRNGDSPVGAFVFWVNQEYLPPPRKGHETQADAQGNQQVWVEGQGWMDTGRAA